MLLTLLKGTRTASAAGSRQQAAGRRPQAAGSRQQGCKENKRRPTGIGGIGFYAGRLGRNFCKSPKFATHRPKTDTTRSRLYPAVLFLWNGVTGKNLWNWDFQSIAAVCATDFSANRRRK